MEGVFSIFVYIQQREFNYMVYRGIGEIINGGFYSVDMFNFIVRKVGEIRFQGDSDFEIDVRIYFYYCFGFVFN